MKRTFIDHLGRAVEIDWPPGRVVSLCPCLTETLFVLGLEQCIVGRTVYCVHPAERIGGVPSVGGTKDADVRAVRELRPDLLSAAQVACELVRRWITAKITIYHARLQARNHAA